MNPNDNQPSHLIYEVKREGLTNEFGELDYSKITLMTGRGDIQIRLYEAGRSDNAAIFVGGVGGDWDSPAQGLYEKLARSLKDAGINSLRVRYRFPTILEETIYDIIAAIEFARQEGAQNIALTGHSLGGAAVLQAGAISGSVQTIVTLATQCYGADAVTQLPEGCSVLLLHGEKDNILPYQCSKQTYDIANNPKELILYAEAGHNLDEVDEVVYKDVYHWITTKLYGKKAA